MTIATSRRGLFHTSALAGALALSIAGGAVAQERVYSIPAQSLAASLRDYGMASGEQIIFAETIVSGRQAPALQGAYESDQALRVLLADSGLIAERVATGGIMIRRADGPQSGSAAGGGADGTVEALIVTAQKREEDIQDVPIAISAFTQEQLERSQVAGGPDLMTQVPNMTFTKTNFTSYSIQLRGIGTQAISATVDPAVAVAFNNTPFIRNRFFEQEFYDLQRVEVLRGPQGTLYGRNATAGVVNLISQKPKFAYEAKVSGDVSNYNSTRLEGMVNIPLAEDVAALRIAGAWTKREGYAFNEITGTPIDGRGLWSTRVSLRFAPTDTVDVNLIWEHFEEDDDRLRSGKQLCKRHMPTHIGGLEIDYDLSGIPGQNNGTNYEEFFSQGCEAASLYSPDSFQAPNGFRLPYYRPLARLALPIVDGNFDPYLSTIQSKDLRVIESTYDPTYKAKSDIVELQAGVDLSDNLTLASETAYLNDFVFSTQDYNRFNTRPGAFGEPGQFPGLIERGVLTPEGAFCDPQIGCADRVVAVDLSTAKSRQFSQELRLSSNYDGTFNFSLGANFLRYDTEDKYYVFINTLGLSAASNASENPLIPDYVAGVSDNRQCLPNGFSPPTVDTVEGLLDCTYIDPNPIGSLNDLGHTYFLSKNPYKLISYAVFGETYYEIAENLKVTAGLRWTVDRKEAPRVPSWVMASDTVGYPVANVVEQEWREPTGRLTVDWKPDLAFTDETLLYASYAHGYKAGGANPPAAGLVMYANSEASPPTDWELQAAAQDAVAPRVFDPEFVNAFELGAKNTMLDGRLTVNLAAFYYDYKAYQISQIVSRSAINLNFDVKVWGLEIEADWRPLENLRLGFKGGYEQTRMADGSRAVDVMDRTAGNPDWFVTAPFPSLPNNCILPTYLVVRPNDPLWVLGYSSGGNLGPCELAYVVGVDPITHVDYQENPPQPLPGFPGTDVWYEGYPGFNPHSAPNGGAGFYKDLSGNELPNAPDFTATITADYTVPLPNEWYATLHTDLYMQSEAWTRVFNTEGYDKLKAYTNVNVAAIFTNEPGGWKVMAYVKNVFDRDSITGAFLNSDDTGLTTNVFLTEPRLYGLRVTKEWSGGPWWTGANLNHTGPYPLTVELGGQVQRHDAPYAPITPDFDDAFSGPLGTIEGMQNRDMDWGDGREVRLTWRPDGAWAVAAGLRYGRTNTDGARFHGEFKTEEVCPFPGKYAILCDPNGPLYLASGSAQTNFSDMFARQTEEHQIADFAVGRDVGIGEGLKSMASLGIRYAELESNTHFDLDGTPDWHWPEGAAKYPSSFHHYTAEFDAQREFKGAGPTLSWAAAAQLLGNDRAGHLDLDWSLTGGVLFGKQKTSMTGQETATYYFGVVNPTTNQVPQSGPTVTTLAPDPRTQSVSVPLIDLSLGLSYEVGRVKVGAGYRWERYFDVLDVGYDEEQSADRTIDGPYFTLAVGFGG